MFSNASFDVSLRPQSTSAVPIGLASSKPGMSWQPKQPYLPIVRRATNSSCRSRAVRRRVMPDRAAARRPSASAPALRECRSCRYCRARAAGIASLVSHSTARSSRSLFSSSVHSSRAGTSVRLPVRLDAQQERRDVGRRVGHDAGRLALRVLLGDRIEEQVRHHRAGVVPVRLLQPRVEPLAALLGVELARRCATGRAPASALMPGNSACEWHARQPRDSNSHLPRSADASSVRPRRGSRYSNSSLCVEQVLGERADLDRLEPQALLQLRQRRRPRSRCSYWPKNCGIRVVGRKSDGLRIQL